MEDRPDKNLSLFLGFFVGMGDDPEVSKDDEDVEETGKFIWSSFSLLTTGVS
jgi:hypothetical protein